MDRNVVGSSAEAVRDSYRPNWFYITALSAFISPTGAAVIGVFKWVHTTLWLHEPLHDYRRVRGQI